MFELTVSMNCLSAAEQRNDTDAPDEARLLPTSTDAPNTRAEVANIAAESRRIFTSRRSSSRRRPFVHHSFVASPSRFTAESPTTGEACSYGAGQSIAAFRTSAVACANAPNAGFALQSGRSTPDCQPSSEESSRSSKLKNAPTAGWQYARRIAAVSCAACSASEIGRLSVSVPV